MRPHGRARVSARNPRALAICDRCGFLYNHVNSSGSLIGAVPRCKTCVFWFATAAMTVTQDGNNTTTQVIGNPNGLEQGAVMPLVGTVTYGAKIPALSVISNGTTTVSVTCSSAHGLSNNSQVSIEGLSINNADGFYSVTVTSATAFTYSTYSAIPSGSLLTNTTNIITALVGLPYNYAQIPQTGP